MNYDDVEVISQQTLYQGFFRTDRFTLRFKLFAGGWSDIVEREVFMRTAAVGVLLHDPKRDQVILVEQFRAGALNHPQTPWMLELVAGIIEPNESPEDVAKRETQEEANCDILQLTPICHYWPSAGGSNEQMQLFYGIVDAEHAGGIYGVKEENEDIKVHVLSTSDAFEQVKNHKIANAAAIIALQWLELKMVASKK